jgi:hypothetical protein
MTPPEEVLPQEPWPKYLEASDDEARLALLQFKVDEARLRWDLLYAHAVAAAVFNYEALKRGGAGAPNALETTAGELISQLGSYGEWGFGEAGGWGHK